ncbi:MAG: WS/DGAT/MGAT family O-acyltransferase [Solirubrobacteraceae bacterium]
MASDRLTPLDASFLHLEDGSSHMHVGAVMIFEGEPPPYDDFVSFVGSRLDLVPRYRQKLAPIPLGQGRPKWVDDPVFDVRFHVRATALPRPGTEYELQVLTARVFSQPLTRQRPLWELWLVEGLEGGRFAVVSKTHHALVDGISGLDLLSVLFSSEEEPADADSGPWRPRPSPAGVALLAEALLERATMPAELVRPALALLRRPRRVAGRALELAVGLGAMAWAGLSPAPPSPYNRPIGGDRRFAWVRAGLEEMKAIKNELGGTVNDVVLTVVTRALRRDLERRGWETDGLELKAFVPISVRAEDERVETGNRVSGMIVPLPVSCEHPATCLRRISGVTRQIKDSGQAVGAQALTELAGFAPPNLLDQAARLTARQRFVNLVVTNVPGPQDALSFEGRQLEDIFPMVPLGKNLALGVAIVSYNGGMHFGLSADFEALPELDALAGDFEAALTELAEAAEVAPVTQATPETPTPPADEPAPPADEPAPPADEPARGPAEALEPEPEHVDEGVGLVAESAEPGAEEGAGPELHVEEPWPNYDSMQAPQIVDRLAASADAELGVVRLYEGSHRRRREVLEATERELARR